MNRAQCAAFILSLTLVAAAHSQTTPSSPQKSARYTEPEMKKLAREANTPAQYATLAAYYTEQQNNYLKQAADEKLEWARRSQNVMVVAAKYPRPVDSARYLYEYYTYKANEDGQLALKYGQKVTPEPASGAK